MRCQIMKLEKLYFRRQCFVFLLILQCVRCRLHIKDSRNISDQLINKSVRILSTITENERCVNIKTYGDAAENLISSTYQEICVPFVTGEKFSICKQRIFIVENKEYVSKFVSPDKFIGIKSFILILNVDCPGDNIENTFHGTEEIVIICFVTNTVYILNLSGGLDKVSDTSTLLPKRYRSFSNFKKKFLRVSTFNCPIFSYGIEGGLNSSSSNIHKLDGIEMKIFLEISKRLNFTWKLQEPPELNKWGQKLNNGTWSGGIVGALVDGRADVGFCCLWIASPQALDIDLTYPWSILCNTFVVPKPRRINKFGAVFFPFQTELWFVLAVTTLLISSVLWCLERIRRYRCASIRVKSLDKHVLDALGIITLTSLSPPTEKLDESRHVVTWWAVFALLMTTAYSSGLVSHLTVPVFEIPLDSIRDLVVSNIQWRHPYLPALDVLFNLEDPWHTKFITNFHLDPSMAKFHHPYPTRNHAALGFVLEGEVPYFLQESPMNISALTSFRVMKECLSRYYISLGLSRNSPYTSAFNQVLIRLVENGIVQHWKESLSLIRSHPEMSNLFAENKEKSSVLEPLTIENVQGAFLLLLIGLTTGTVTFCLEMCFILKLQITKCAPTIITLPFKTWNGENLEKRR